MSRPSRKDDVSRATAVNPRALEFRQQLDGHTRTLVESFGTLLRSAKITNPQSITREEFQVNVATASLATAGEGLLRQIREVKLAVMLQDEAAMDREMDQALEKITEERKELEKEIEALSNELSAAYARVAMAGQESTEPLDGGSEASANSFTLMDMLPETSGEGGDPLDPFDGAAIFFAPMDVTESGVIGMDHGAP